MGFILLVHVQIKMKWRLAERVSQMSDLRGACDEGYMINPIVQQTPGEQQVNYKEFIEVIGFGIHVLFHQREDKDGEIEKKGDRKRMTERVGEIKGGKVKLTFSPELLQTVTERRAGRGYRDESN